MKYHPKFAKGSGSRCRALLRKFSVKEFLERRRSARRTTNLVVRTPKPFTPRLIYPWKDPLKSPWWEYVLGGTWADPIGRDGKLFRRRFRATHKFFMELVSKVKELFPDHAKKDAAGGTSFCRKVGPVLTCENSFRWNWGINLYGGSTSI